MQAGDAAIELRGPRAQAGLAHEPRHAASADAETSGDERAMDARAAIRPAAMGEDLADRHEQSAVLSTPRALGASPPRVVAGARDTVEPTEPGGRELVPLCVDEGEDLRLRAEQNRMAFLGARAPP
jgi:hypothetical protein